MRFGKNFPPEPDTDNGDGLHQLDTTSIKIALTYVYEQLCPGRKQLFMDYSHRFKKDQFCWFQKL